MRDREKLDDYLTSVRDVERRIQLAEKQFGDPANPDVYTPAGIPPNYKDHIALMFSMLTLAFQTDSTRIGTLLLAHDGSNRPFPELEITSGHHDLTHHMGNVEKLDKVGQIDRWYMEQFASFLEDVRKTKDIDDKSLLDNSDDRLRLRQCRRQPPHACELAHRARWRRRRSHAGRYVKHNSKPACNLFLETLDRMVCRASIVSAIRRIGWRICKLRFIIRCRERVGYG